MKTIPVDRLTTNFINLLEEIATTGDPIELDWQGKRLQILPIQKKANLTILYLTQKYILAILTIL
ncbi:MAG: hypothetical protein NT070_12935 [Cyanobacteria bacterium]|nr:hypothetical protein [Cyanobacteriota bacterium]